MKWPPVRLRHEQRRLIVDDLSRIASLRRFELHVVVALPARENLVDDDQVVHRRASTRDAREDERHDDRQRSSPDDTRTSAAFS